MRAGVVVSGWTRQGAQRYDSRPLPLFCILPRLLRQEQARVEACLSALLPRLRNRKENNS